MTIRLLTGDCRDVLATLPEASVHCVVTSPPYYGLRDYGTAQWEGGDAACDHAQPIRPQRDNSGGLVNNRLDTRGNQSWSDATGKAQYRDVCGKCGARRVDRQLGLEATPEAYLAAMVEVFRAVRRVLRDDGTCWVNIGDSYAGGAQYGAARSGEYIGDGGKAPPNVRNRNGVGAVSGAKPKDLLLMPARLALALQADGWWIRSDIIWHKPNPMPESCTDRPTSAHEHVFLLSKRKTYFYDADAVKEDGSGRACGNRVYKYDGLAGHETKQGVLKVADVEWHMRSCRNVWTIPTAPFADAHFATFPPALVERCIRAGTKLGDTVLDPFVGSGTTALVADRLQRHAIGIDLSIDYAAMAQRRLEDDCPLFTAWAPAETDAQDERMRDLFSAAAD